jgi:hypothetical protein
MEEYLSMQTIEINGLKYQESLKQNTFLYKLHRLADGIQLLKHSPLCERDIKLFSSYS